MLQKAIFTILLGLPVFCFSQLHKLEGKCFDVGYQENLIFCEVQLIQDGVVIDTSITDLYGTFAFDSLQNGTYTLFTKHLMYPAERVSVTVPKDKKVNIKMRLDHLDSLMKEVNLDTTYMMYTTGCGWYAPKLLNKVGEKYGVKWDYLPGYQDERIEFYHQLVEGIIMMKHGENWFQNFRTDIDEFRQDKKD